VGFRSITSWWPRSRLLRQVRKALESTVSSAPPPRSLLNGSGVILVPADPVEAALTALAVRDFCLQLSCPVRLAGPPRSLRWIPDQPGTSPIEIPETLGGRTFSEWLEYHRAHRADWCLLVSPHPTVLEEACLAWLGMGTRFAAFGACHSKAANVLIQTDPESSLDTRTRRLLRVLQPELPALRNRPATTTGPVLVEVPPDLLEKGARSREWMRRITEMANQHPILLAHSEALPESIHDLVRSFGPKVALAHLSSAHEVQELARRTGRWVASRTPASALAALEGCNVHLVGRSHGADDFPHPERLTISAKIDGLDPDSLV